MSPASRTGRVSGRPPRLSPDVDTPHAEKGHPANSAAARGATLFGSSRLYSLVLEGTENVWVQFLRYGVVGGIAFACDFGSLFALTEFAGLHYLVSAAIAFVIGLAVNYVLSIVWVFKTRSMTNLKAEFAVFAGIGVVGLLINEVVMWAMTDGAGTHYLASKIVATAVGYVWNFWARRRALFS